MRVFIRGPHLGPVRTTLWSSGGRKSGSKSYAGRFILAVILLGATFGLSPVLGWLVLALTAVSIVTYAVVQVCAAVRHGKPGKAATGRETAGWRADHVPASAEYKAAHPAGPRDWTA